MSRIGIWAATCAPNMINTFLLVTIAFSYFEIIYLIINWFICIFVMKNVF